MAYFTENTQVWKEIASSIHRSDNVYISTHVNPDGDAIGSEVALAYFLGKINKSCRILNHSETPQLYRFLDSGNKIECFSKSNIRAASPQKNDLVVFLDIGSYGRAGDVVDFLLSDDAQKIFIDHHSPEPVDADIVVVNPGAAATGSLVYDLLCSIDESIVDKQIATALLTAIVTDTGFFSYSNTTATTHRIAVSLYEHGASGDKIRGKLDIGKPISRQKIMGQALVHTKLSNCGRIAYSYLTESMFRKAGALKEHTDGLINHIRSIENIEIAVLIVQNGENIYKASFRSAGSVHVNKIASMLGGGGHIKAAGANVAGSLDEVISKVLDAAVAVLDNKKRL